jgi:hypothetical protein
MPAAVGLLLAVLASAACAPHDGDTEPLGRSGLALGANDKTAFDYFLGKGLTGYQAAGIVGNLDQESSMDPKAAEAGGPGRGIAQWSVGGRWDATANDNTTAYAGARGASVYALTLQLDFIWYELTTFPHYGLAALESSKDVSEATLAFEKDFEGCGTCLESQRVAYAQAALAAYGGDSVDGGGDGGDRCDVPGVGAGACMPTAACAKLPGHVSTPGYCPGAADIECCTGQATSGGGGGGTASADPHATGGGAPPSPSAAASAAPPADPAAGTGGCMATPARARGAAWGQAGLALCLGLVLARRRRAH